MEQPIDPNRAPRISRDIAGETERALIGTETVDARARKNLSSRILRTAGKNSCTNG